MRRRRRQEKVPVRNPEEEDAMMMIRRAVEMVSCPGVVVWMTDGVLGIHTVINSTYIYTYRSRSSLMIMAEVGKLLAPTCKQEVPAIITYESNSYLFHRPP